MISSLSVCLLLYCTGASRQSFTFPLNVRYYRRFPVLWNVVGGRHFIMVSPVSFHNSCLPIFFSLFWWMADGFYLISDVSC
jgi:hypothetical protein